MIKNKLKEIIILTNTIAICKQFEHYSEMQ